MENYKRTRKIIGAREKKEIQQKFWNELHLIVDHPKQGFGTSNDGNTARTFFQNYEKAAMILGIEKSLIYRFYVILQIISSDHNFDIPRFEKYCKDTFEFYISKYSWYYLPTSIHKLLIHSGKIAEKSILPFTGAA